MLPSPPTPAQNRNQDQSEQQRAGALRDRRGLEMHEARAGAEGPGRAAEGANQHAIANLVSLVGWEDQRVGNLQRAGRVPVQTRGLLARIQQEFEGIESRDVFAPAITLRHQR